MILCRLNSILIVYEPFSTHTYFQSVLFDTM
jgi:hypothetical protein